MNSDKVGKLICEERKKRNLTQKQLADLLNVTDKAVSRWETGKGYPDIEILVKLSDAFDISVNELLNGERIEKENIPHTADEQIVIAYRKENETKKKSKKIILAVLAAAVLVCFMLANAVSQQLNVEEQIIYSEADSYDFHCLAEELKVILGETHGISANGIFEDIVCTGFFSTVNTENEIEDFDIKLVNLIYKQQYEISFDKSDNSWYIKKTKQKGEGESEGIPFYSTFNALISIDFSALCRDNAPSGDSYSNFFVDLGNRQIFTGKEAAVGGDNTYLFEDNTVKKVTNTKALDGTYYSFVVTPKIAVTENEVFASCCNVYIKG